MIKMKQVLAIGILAMTVTVNAQTVAYSEDFQSGLPVSYTIVDNDGLTPDASVSEFTAAWIEYVDPDNITDTVAASTSYFDPTGSADRWLITPAITLGNYGNFLYWEAKSHDASYPDGYQILISTTDTQISSFTDTLDAVQTESEYWQSRDLNLSELGYDTPQTVYIAFVNRTNDGFKLYLDDISVEIEDPRGLKPAGLNDLNAEMINIYPNPTGDFLQLSVTHDRVRIYARDGKLVLESNEKSIDVRSLVEGYYFIDIETSKGSIRKTFIKI